MKTLVIIIKWFLLLCPIALWVLLLTMPRYTWSGGGITIMVMITLLSWLSAAMIYDNSPEKNENDDDEDVDDYPYSQHYN